MCVFMSGNSGAPKPGNYSLCIHRVKAANRLIVEILDYKPYPKVKFINIMLRHLRRHLFDLVKSLAHFVPPRKLKEHSKQACLPNKLMVILYTHHTAF